MLVKIIEDLKDRCQLYLFRMAVYYDNHTTWDEENKVVVLKSTYINKGS